MIYIYRRASSTGARELAEALDGVRYRALQRPMEQKARRGDVVICWGESLPPINGVKILNGTPIQSKFTDAVKLKEAGVSTIEVSRTRPVVAAAAVADPARVVWEQVSESMKEFLDTDYSRNSRPYLDGIAQLHASIGSLNAAIRVPLPAALPMSVWLPRSNSHTGGVDLLRPIANGDFFVKKEAIMREFRIHSFHNKSLRAGIKAHRDGFQNPHEWVRSWDGGWRISYDGISSRKAHRQLAHKAVSALELDFAAVDIGERADGSLIVLEANRAPGLEGGTVTAYVNAIQRWIAGREDRDDA